MTERATTTPATERPPFGVAAVVTAAIFALYALTIAPTTQFWDTSEYIAAAKVLGIPHPPGNPLFVLMANVWGQIPLVGHYALRINLFAAVTSAISSGLLFLVTERFLQPFIGSRWPRIFAAFSGTLVGATAFTVWNQSVVNEKVYTLSLLFIALVLALIVRWGDLEPGARRDKLLLLTGYILVLTSTNHLMGVLAAPAVAVYILVTDWKEILRPWVLLLALMGTLAITGKWTTVVDGPDVWRFGVLLAVAAAFAYVVWRSPRDFARPMLWVAIAAVVVGISLNFTFLPLRAAQFPPINEGEPASWAALTDVLERFQYQKPPVTQRMADFSSQVANYLQYYSWQFGRDFEQDARRLLAVTFGLLGLLGAYQQWRRDKRAALAMGALMVTVTILLVAYLNFRYGYSIRPGEDLSREVRERDYFFVASFQLWGIWVGLGLGSLFAAAQGFLRQRLDTTLSWIAAGPVLLIALIPLGGNWLTAPRAGETLARDFAVDFLQSVEPYAILVTAGDNDLFPLWYAQEVEGVRRDVLVVNQSLMNTEWHIRQIMRRETFPFDLENAIPPYRDFSGTAPEGPLLDLSMEAVDSLPLFFDVAERSIFRAGTIEAVIQPGRYDRATLITLQLIQQNLGKRPIYFGRTTGPTGEALGLAPYLLSQGFVRRVMPEPIEEAPDTLPVQGIGWIDLRRTEDLLFDVYHPEAAARDRPRGWIDPPSQNILSLYYVTYAAYGQIATVLDTTNTERVRLGGIAQGLAERMLENLQF